MTESNQNKKYLIQKPDFECSKESSEKIHSEAFSLFLFGLSAGFYGISGFHLKYIQYYFKKDYNVFSFGIWRYISMTILVYAYMKYKEIEIDDYRKLSETGKHWFIVRTVGSLISLVLYMLSLEYLRVSTANCFVSMSPAAILIISTVLLKEKFHWRYPIGISFCFIGVLMIISNENVTNVIDNTQESSFDVLIGIIWGSMNLITIALLYVSSKKLHIEKFEQENQCLYIAVSNLIISFVIAILTRKLNFSFYYIFMSSLNAILFLAATFLNIFSLRGVELNKTTALNYLTIVVSTFLSIIFLGESLFFTDVLGSLIILGYNIYNSLYPIVDSNN